MYNNTIASNKGNYTLVIDATNPYQWHAINNIFYDNTLNNSSNTISNVALLHNNSYIQNSTNTANGNIDGTLDPTFINPDTNVFTANYKLLNCSPLINKGDTVGISTYLGQNDLAQLNRYKNTIDIGAYEYQNDITSPNYIATATLTNNSTNNVKLVKYRCDEDGWTYYAHPTHNDSIVMAINWKNNLPSVKESANVFLEVNDLNTQTNATNDSALTALPRRWFIELAILPTRLPIDVRFFYDDNDSAIIANEALAANRNINGNILWTAMYYPGNTQQYYTYNEINNGNYETLNGTVNNINGIKYMEFNNIASWSTGVGFLRSTKKNVGIATIEAENCTIYPNPVTNTLNINSTIDGTIYVKNIQGATLHQTIKNETVTILDLNHLNAGVYILEIVGAENTTQLKFVKQ